MTTREDLIDYMVAEALAEDAREESKFDMQGFGNFFPEYRTDAADHGVEWDDSIWDEAFDAYVRARNGERKLSWWQHYAPPPDNENPADWAEAEAAYLKDLDK